MKRRVAQFATEAEMCARFIAIAMGARPLYNGRGRARPTGWIAYPETAGYDIVLVRERDGFQIAVEAKLHLNDAVIQQIIECGRSPCAAGPDCRAVLVPYGSGTWLHREFCQRVGVQVITVRNDADDSASRYPQIQPEPPRADVDDWDRWSDSWPQMLPVVRLDLPSIVPDCIAGAPSPSPLTPWKLKALKIAVLLERRGWVCRQDFKHIGIDHRRWIDGGWVIVADGAWRIGPNCPDFRKAHPRNIDEIGALISDWAPPELLTPPATKPGRLL